MKLSGEHENDILFLDFSSGEPINHLSEKNCQSAVQKSFFRNNIRSAVAAAIPSPLKRVKQKIFPVHSQLRSRIDRQLEKHGIQFAFLTDPALPMPTEVPYGTIMWDLQHRVNPWFPEVKKNGMFEIREASAQTLLQRAAFIITGTEQGKHDIQSFYGVPSNRITVCPFAVPSAILNHCHQSFEKQNSPIWIPRSEYVFYPAQFWPHKNHVVIIDACKLLKDNYNWSLKIVFTGSEKGNYNYIRDYAKDAGLAESTIFPGLVSIGELVSAYRSAFALTFASYCGPDNLPPLEAMALECPVVTSDIPGAREQLGSCAEFFEPSSAKSLADALRRLRQSGRREMLQKQGVGWASKNTWENYANVVFDEINKFSTIRKCWR